MNKITADWIYPISSQPLQKHVITYDDDGTILNIDSIDHHDIHTIKKYSGVIIPGFINAHCHLELSHLKGLAPTGTGLIDFISHIVQFRDADMDQILASIETQDQYMWEQGIQAVGDISNASHTSQTKTHSPIRYHTFIEMFDFLNPDMTEASYAQYFESYENMTLKNGDKKSLVPHAPYTVSPQLFEKINVFNKDNDVSVSIHNQESPSENSFFINKTGELINFYKNFGISLDHFSPTGKRSIHYALPQMDADKKTLLVHNTTCNTDDIAYAHQWSDQVTWVSCPNANLYIENQLPDYKSFIDSNQNIAIGTDSLSSNWQLSILEEIKTIKKYKSFVPVELLLRWATLNGACALGFDGNLGSLEKGKQPGLLLLKTFDSDGAIINGESEVKRLL